MRNYLSFNFINKENTNNSIIKLTHSLVEMALKSSCEIMFFLIVVELKNSLLKSSLIFRPSCPLFSCKELLHRLCLKIIAQRTRVQLRLKKCKSFDSVEISLFLLKLGMGFVSVFLGTIGDDDCRFSGDVIKSIIEAVNNSRFEEKMVYYELFHAFRGHLKTSYFEPYYDELMKDICECVKADKAVNAKKNVFSVLLQLTYAVKWQIKSAANNNEKLLDSLSDLRNEILTCECAQTKKNYFLVVSALLAKSPHEIKNREDLVLKTLSNIQIQDMQMDHFQKIWPFFMEILSHFSVFFIFLETIINIYVFLKKWAINR